MQERIKKVVYKSKTGTALLYTSWNRSRSNDLSREIAAGHVGIEEAIKKLKKIDKMPVKRIPYQIAAAGLSAGGLGYLLGGTAMEAFVAFFVGCVVFSWSLFAGKHGVSKILIHIVGGIIIASMALAAMQIPFLGKLRMEGIVTGGIMPLVPGLAFVNAIRDLADSDYLAGTVKMIDAVMVFVYIAIGVGTALSVYHHVLGGIFIMIIKIIANLACSFIGTIAYAVMFQVPRRFYIGCGITGSVGWMMYKFASVYCSVAVASFIGTVCAVLVARMLTVRLKCPITIFMISGIITLVPGAGIYFTAYYLVTNQFAMAAAKGIGAIKVAFGIVLGIVCIVSVPREVFQKEYWVERKIAKQQKNGKRDPVNLPGERHR